MRARLTFGVLLLAMTACGAAPSPPDSSPDAAIVVHPALAEIAPAAPPATGARISGTVEQPAHAPGPCFVAAAQRLDALIVGDVSAGTTVGADGRFTLDGLTYGTYYVAAFVDTDGNGQFQRQTEPYVAWPAAIVLDGVTPVPEIALHHFLNLPDPAVRTPSRLREVDTLLAAAEAQFAAVLREGLPASADGDRLLPTIRVTLTECTRLWRTADAEETWTFVHDTLAAIPEWLDTARRGADPLAHDSGWQLRGFVRPPDGAVAPYLVYIPRTAAPDTPLPLVLGLHGGGGNHWSGARMVVGGAGLDAFGPDRSTALWPPEPKQDVFVVTPSGDRSASALPWRVFGEVNALGALDAVRSRNAIDPDRVYLTGLSDGGRGAWEIGTRYPDRFAAILIGAGATDNARFLCMNVAHVPVRVVHGRHDTLIPVEHARAIVRAGAPFDAHIAYEEVDRGHDVADLCYANGAGLAWLLQYRRARVPPLVRFRTDTLLYNEGAGVIVMDGEQPGQVMDVEVAWAEPGRVRVTSTNVRSLELRVPAEASPPLEITWNGTPLHIERDTAAIHLRAEMNASGQLHRTAEGGPPVAIQPLGPWGHPRT